MIDTPNIKIGTILYHTRYRVAGKVVGFNAGVGRHRWYDVDSDLEYYWKPEEVYVINDKEYLACQLKNSTPNRNNYEWY